MDEKLYQKMVRISAGLVGSILGFFLAGFGLMGLFIAVVISIAAFSNFTDREFMFKPKWVN